MKLAKDMEAMGCQTICIKDMAGIMGPQEAYDTVKALKENVKVPIILHTHSTTGLGMLTLQKQWKRAAMSLIPQSPASPAALPKRRPKPWPTH